MGYTRLGPGIRPKMRDAIVEIRNYLYPQKGDVYYVSKRGASGDGKSWEQSFLTITEGIAALTDDDTLIIGAGNYDEAAKISLDNVDNVRIFGMSNGMQWGEGSTNWRDVTSETDLLDISGCKSVEIAGIGFVVTTADKDAINFDGLNYSVHIHDCCFTGDCGGGTKMAYAINGAGSNAPDLYVHDCRFFVIKTAAIVMGHQRNVIRNNFFIIPASGHGINYASGTSPFNLIADNYFLGVNSSDVGISGTAGAVGNEMIVNNIFCGLSSEISTSKDENCVNNFYADYTTGGGVRADCDPEA